MHNAHVIEALATEVERLRAQLVASEQLSLSTLELMKTTLEVLTPTGAGRDDKVKMELVHMLAQHVAEVKAAVEQLRSTK